MQRNVSIVTKCNNCSNMCFEELVSLETEQLEVIKEHDRIL